MFVIYNQRTARRPSNVISVAQKENQILLFCSLLHFSDSVLFYLCSLLCRSEKLAPVWPLAFSCTTTQPPPFSNSCIVPASIQTVTIGEY